MTSRFAEEGSQEPYVAFVKTLTSKPVVGVGRFTSPDTMVAQIRAACSISSAPRGPPSPIPSCRGRSRRAARRTSANASAATSACSATTTARRSAAPRTRPWARNGAAAGIPRASRPKASDDRCWSSAPGPPGLEARGARPARLSVVLGRGGRRAGRPGRARGRLPGLAEWARVRDYRMGQLGDWRMSRSTARAGSTADEIREFGFAHVVIATGARWRSDGVGRAHPRPIPIDRRAGAHARRHDGWGAPAGAGRRLRRRPLLHGRRALRAARRPRVGTSPWSRPRRSPPTGP